jgi:hypothetical protein
VTSFVLRLRRRFLLHARSGIRNQSLRAVWLRQAFDAHLRSAAARRDKRGVDLISDALPFVRL